MKISLLTLLVAASTLTLLIFSCEKQPEPSSLSSSPIKPRYSDPYFDPYVNSPLKEYADMDIVDANVEAFSLVSDFFNGDSNALIEFKEFYTGNLDRAARYIINRYLESISEDTIAIAPNLYHYVDLDTIAQIYSLSQGAKSILSDVESCIDNNALLDTAYSIFADYLDQLDLSSLSAAERELIATALYSTQIMYNWSEHEDDVMGWYSCPGCAGRFHLRWCHVKCIVGAGIATAAGASAAVIPGLVAGSLWILGGPCDDMVTGNC